MNPKLIIDRLTWARGGKNGRSSLLNIHNNRCCLGFECKRLGVSDSDMLSVGRPVNITKPSRLPGYMADTTFIDSLIIVNDDPQMDEINREFKITELFATKNIDVEFIN